VLVVVYNFHCVILGIVGRYQFMSHFAHYMYL
jgi:hypothetical protein